MRASMALASVVAAVALPLAVAAPANAVPSQFTVANCEAGLNGQNFSVPTGTTAATINFTANCNANTPPAQQGASQNPPNFGLSLSPSVTWDMNSEWVQNTIWARVNFTGTNAPISIGFQYSPVNMMTPIPDGSYTFYYATFPTNTTPNYSGSFTLTVGAGGGSSGSTGTAAPAPVLETLSLSVAASGASCTGGNPTGYSGTWMTLPKADACTQSGPNAKPGAKLLGWSPNANFPVDVAQNQIAKGWGVYDGPIGGVRMIFIPAGMSTFVSGSNTLYPVWSA